MFQNLWAQRLLTAAVWAVAIGSATFWVMTRPGADMAQANQPVAASALVADAGGLRALLGASRPVEQQATPRAPVADTRYALVGVLAGTQSGQGAALIAVDGERARTYRVGATVDGRDGLVVQAVEGRRARLGPALQQEATLVLELPEFSPAPASATPAPRAMPGGAPLPAPRNPHTGAPVDPPSGSGLQPAPGR